MVPNHTMLGPMIPDAMLRYIRSIRRRPAARRGSRLMVPDHAAPAPMIPSPMIRSIRGRRAGPWRLALRLLVLLPALLLPSAPRAHDLPDHLDLRIMVKPEGEVLHVVARVPLALLEGQALPKRGADLLDLARIEEPLRRSALAVARTFVFFADGERLTPDQGQWRVSPPDAPALASFEDAEAHFSAPPLSDSAEVAWNDGWFDVYLLYPIASPDSAFALRPQLRGLGGILSLHVDYMPQPGSTLSHDVGPDARTIALNPG